MILKDENAVVQGVVTTDGLFDGTIATKFEEFYIEPTARYLDENEDTSPTYHSIAYRTSDVTVPPHPLPCASHQLHEGSLRDTFDRGKTYNDTSEGFYEPLLDNKIGLYSKESHGRILNLETKNEARYYDRSSGDRVARHLHKRATVDPRKTTCMLYLQADHQFFARYGTEEACIEVMTRHVQKVNSIYKHTGRSWTIRLIRDDTIFSKDVTFEGTHGSIPFDVSHSYAGTVLGMFVDILV
ncbi:hypothetical protein HZH68_006645 [Vespula germanica]|uniref:Uncharacterized protein n=1 Tax=Vespula germanica TaxID=30212 RepID=A0A834KBT5_VESGE|nr:hypothetical protein HZH68_006645 [Vespula germanica]